MDYIRCNVCGENNSRLIFVKNSYNIVQCNKCGLIYINPQPSQEECNNLYSRETKYFPDLVHNDPSEESEHVRLKDIKKFKDNGRILDIGCGDGRFLVTAQRNGYDVYGIEISKDMVELLTAKYNLNIISNSLEQADVPGKYFDII